MISTFATKAAVEGCIIKNSIGPKGELAAHVITVNSAAHFTPGQREFLKTRLQKMFIYNDLRENDNLNNEM